MDTAAPHYDDSNYNRRIANVSVVIEQDPSTSTYRLHQGDPKDDGEPVKRGLFSRIGFFLLFHILNVIATLASVVVALPTIIVALTAKCVGSSATGSACCQVSYMLASLDVRVANFIGRKCFMQTSKMAVDPRVRESRCMSVLRYLVSKKLVAAGVSVLAVLLSQGVPGYVMNSKGGNLCGFLGFTFHTKPVAYVIVMLSAFAAGWTCVFLGPKLSMKFTREACVDDKTTVELPHHVQATAPRV